MGELTTGEKIVPGDSSLGHAILSNHVIATRMFLKHQTHVPNPFKKYNKLIIMKHIKPNI